MIEILSAGALATVQDLGRTGACAGASAPRARWTRWRSRPATCCSATTTDAAAIEVPVFPFQVRFAEDCAFARDRRRLRGAAGRSRRCCPGGRTQARAGQVLQLGLPQGGALARAAAPTCAWPAASMCPRCWARAARSCAAPSAAIEGRALRHGDTLRAGSGAGRSCRDRLRPRAAGAGPAAAGRRPARGAGAAGGRVHGLHARPRAPPSGPESLEDHGAERPLRLPAGRRRRCEPVAPMEMRSHGIVPGVIQVPPGGQPIVQMRDAQPSGGYPKIGTVIEADLWRLGQAPIGSRIRFVETTWDEAVAALGRDPGAGWTRRAASSTCTACASGRTDMQRLNNCSSWPPGWRPPTSACWSCAARRALCACGATARRRRRDRAARWRRRRQPRRRRASSPRALGRRVPAPPPAARRRLWRAVGDARARPARPWACCRSARCCCR